MNLLSKFDVNSLLGVEENVIQNWLTLIESKYHSSNSYHNSTHAADVLQVIYVVLHVIHDRVHVPLALVS